MKNLEPNISFDGFYECDHTLYMSSCAFNGLLEVDAESGIVRNVKRFGEEMLLSQLSHRNVIRVKDDLIFILNFSPFIHIYNVSTNEVKTVKVKKDEWSAFRCVDSIVIDNKLWLITSFVDNGLISMDLDSYEITYYDDFYREAQGVVDETTAIFWMKLSAKEHVLYGAFDNKGSIIKIDLAHRIFEVINIEEGRHFSDITICNEIVYLTEYYSEEILAYHLDTKKLERLSVNQFDSGGVQTVFSNVIAHESLVFLIPDIGRDIFVIEDSQVRKIGELPENFADLQDFRKVWKRFYNYEFRNNKLYLYPNKANMMVMIDLDTFQIEGKIFTMGQDWIDTVYYNQYVPAYISECCEQGVTLIENDHIDLELWLKYV